MKNRKLVEILLFIWCLFCIGASGSALAKLVFMFIKSRYDIIQSICFGASLLIIAFFADYFGRAERKEKDRADHFEYLYMKEKQEHEDYVSYVIQQSRKDDK